MKVVFADTFYYLALLNPGDSRHQAAIEYTAAFRGRMITTAWVLTELADALARPQNRAAFLQVLSQLRADPEITIVPASEAAFDDGVRLFEMRPDKHWTLTDCISIAIMKQEAIGQALTADRHFEQAGFVALLK